MIITIGKLLNLIFILLALTVGWYLGANHNVQSLALHQDRTSLSEEKELYTCGMHPQVIQDKPGNCPICGMELVKLKSSRGGEYNAVEIEPQIEQNMGLRLAVVKAGKLSRSVRTAGYLTEAESRVYEVNLLVSGWIRKLNAVATGMLIEKGAPLFDLYSPEVQVALAELIEARKAGGGSPMKGIYQNAVRKLERWGLPRQQVEDLARRDSAPDTVTIYSPMRGYVSEKNIVEGAAVASGTKALKLVDYSNLWLDAQIFPQDLPFVQRAEKAILSTNSLPGTTFAALVTQAVLPVDADTRTATIRLDVQNPLLLLRPGMFVAVDFSLKSVGEQLLIPRDAVIDSGVRRLVFVSKGRGNYEPRSVEIGLVGDDGLVQVLSGLNVQEEVVVSGQFLLDSESRLQEAIKKFSAPQATEDRGPANVGQYVVSTAEQNAVDKLVTSYLKFSRELGEVEKKEVTYNTSDISEAALALQSKVLSRELKALAEQINQAASELGGKPSSAQREAFKKLSSAVVKLVSVVSPSPAISNSLFLFHCPMADADWLQSEKKIANPYYSNSMKSCGELVKEIGSN